MGMRVHMAERMVSIPMVDRLGNHKYSNKRASTHSLGHSRVGQAVASETHPISFRQHGSSAHSKNQL